MKHVRKQQFHLQHSASMSFYNILGGKKEMTETTQFHKI